MQTIEKTKVQKWGNSMAVRLPKTFVSRLSLTPGKMLNMSSVKDGIVLRINKEKSFDELLAEIDPSNMPELIDWGPNVGKEIVEW